MDTPILKFQSPRSGKFVSNGDDNDIRTEASAQGVSIP